MNRISPEITKLDQGHLDKVVALEAKHATNPWSEKAFIGEFQHECSYAYGAFFEDCLIGYCFTQICAEEISILNILVDGAWRGQGIGKSLLSRVLNEAQGHGVRCAYLEVRPSNSLALALYRHFGFQCLGTRRGYYRDNGEDANVMIAAV